MSREELIKEIKATEQLIKEAKSPYLKRDKQKYLKKLYRRLKWEQ